MSAMAQSKVLVASVAVLVMSGESPQFRLGVSLSGGLEACNKDISKSLYQFRAVPAGYGHSVNPRVLSEDRGCCRAAETPLTIDRRAGRHRCRSTSDQR